MLHKDMEELGGKVLRGGVIRRLEDVRIFQMEVNLKRVYNTWDICDWKFYSPGCREEECK